MSEIRITPSATGKRLLITTPYDADFVADVKEMGGRWEAAKRAWSVDVRDEERARELLRLHYGTDGSPEELADVVTVRIALSRFALSYREGAKARFAGRIIASRAGRDAPVRLSAGVVLVEGTLPGSGGSMRYPELNAGDAVVEVRDVPRAALQVYDGGYEIVSEGAPGVQGPDAEELRARRAELLEQVRELDALLQQLDPEGEAARVDQAKQREHEEIARRLRAEHLQDKAAAIAELVSAQQQREREQAEELGRRRQEEEDAVAASLLRPAPCRCGAHTCAPQAPTAQEYAQRVGRSTATVVEWCRSGKVSAVRHGRRWYVTAA